MTPVRRPRPRPLNQVRVRVTVVATLAALAVGVIGSLLFMTTLRGAMDRQLITSGDQQVQGVQAQLNGGESPERAVVTGKNDIVIQIVDPAGTVIATDHPRVTTPMRTEPGTAKGVRVKRLEDNYVVVARRARNGGDLIVVGRSSEQVERATRTAALLLTVSVPIALAVLAMAVWISVGRALRPVEAMRREAATITATHRHQRLAVPEGDDEIPRLAATLNEMLDRMDAATASQRQFVSDASHELRSPLAALRQLAEVASKYPDKVAPGALARDVLLEETRMEEMVTALLLLARLDDTAPSERTEVDLDDVVLEQVRRLGTDSAPRVDASGVSAGQVIGDRVLLGRLVANLLANALRHARSEVRVTLHEYDELVVLTVDDDGTGIPEQERGRVFERFVRLDDARTRDQGGSGLGLAIVRKVVEDAQGTVAVQESDLGGARFVVSLPSEGAVA
jgi:signal transduction histidine kinase